VSVAERAVVNCEIKRREIGLTNNRRDHRRDQVLDQCGDDRSEGDANHDSDCKIDHVSSQQEGFELVQHPGHPLPGFFPSRNHSGSARALREVAIH
jgi:hypothetical protein